MNLTIVYLATIPLFSSLREKDKISMPYCFRKLTFWPISHDVICQVILKIITFSFCNFFLCFNMIL